MIHDSLNYLKEWACRMIKFIINAGKDIIE